MHKRLRYLMLYLGPIVAVAVVLSMMAAGWFRDASVVAGITTLCALWWVFEPIPIPATSLIPLGLFPLFGILDGKQIAASYGHPMPLCSAVAESPLNRW